MGLGLALTLLLAVPAVAQQPPAPGASKPKANSSISDNVGDISFGYLYASVTSKGSGVTQKYSKGWDFTAAKRVARGLSIIASAGELIGPNINNINLRVQQTPSQFFFYEGGIRFSTKNNAMASGKRMVIKPFLDFMYGGSNDNATLMNHQSVMHVSAGIDLQMANHASIRVQAGSPFFFFFGPVTLGYQIQAGLVVPFSK